MWALFCETNSGFFNIDNVEEKCRTQNTDMEVVYPKIEKFFLIGLHFYTGGAIRCSINSFERARANRKDKAICD